MSESHSSNPARRFYRDIELRTVEAVEDIEKNFGRTLRSMFGDDIKPELLSPGEETDIKNFITFAAKRLAAGAIASRIFHKRIQEGNVEPALNKLTPMRLVGHDAMHAMVAYLRSGGASAVPAYMKVEEEKDMLTSSEAMVEEDYVTFFSGMDSIRRFFKWETREGLMHRPTDDELISSAISMWEHTIATSRYCEDADKYRLKEITSVLRNLLADVRKETPDPNFAVHEFQRLLKPLLQRLRTTPH